ncbi:aminodeoxychorismate synthase component I [Paenibacillus sp. sgz500958]|uniref:aminodeoxychorismate synthase component I n=1 Tax=Paenibacillus sp. sgz500958 TaxID=3242475 RepID=UPI0036D417BD
MKTIPQESIVPRGHSRSSEQTNSKIQVVSRKLDYFFDPERVFMHFFAHEDYAYWLDSSRVNQNLSRFSFMGSNQGALSHVLSYDTNKKLLSILDKNGQRDTAISIFDFLDQQLEYLFTKNDNLPFDFNAGYVGYFGYELKAEFGAEIKHISEHPDAMFILADQLIAFDHEEKCIYLVSLVTPDRIQDAEQWFDDTESRLQTMPEWVPVEFNPESGNEGLEMCWSQTYEEYLESIKLCQHYIKEGETYEVCLTNQLRIKEKFDPLRTYRILRKINPAPYSAYFKFNDFNVLSSSPERFLRINQDRIVEAKPIKGTIARSNDPVIDAQLADELQSSDKDRAENLMIVDLLRNDLGSVCEIGTIKVTKLMDIESYQTVHQLVSTIEGKLREELGAIDCIRVAFPGGSMTGAPKIRTMKYIDEIESTARGIYSGAIGFLGLNGSTDLNIVIRTLVLTPEEATLGVGGAVIILSDPEKEYEEILLKSKALIKALSISKHCSLVPARSF